MDIKCRLSKESPFINWAPLVDLLFLLTAFLLMAQIASPPSLLLRLPKEEGITPLENAIQSLILVIDRDLLLLFGKEKKLIDLPSLGHILEEAIDRRIHRGTHPPVLHIAIDKEVPYEIVAKALRIAKEAQVDVRLDFGAN